MSTIYHDPDLYAAAKKIKLLKSNSVISTVSTLWKGEVIMCQFSHLDRKIVSVTATQIFYPEDFDNLEKVICNFFNDVS